MGIIIAKAMPETVLANQTVKGRLPLATPSVW